jgi:ABC-type transport system involved in multi-copper enzyme maturation permease subunit
MVISTISTHSVLHFLSLSWLTGPIFDKELRVSSRRKRNYLLRFAYILFLTIFILSIWYSTVGIRSSGSAVYIASRLSQAGRQLITIISWFQFIAAQLIAIVMLSSSVSAEIHAGTLSVLLTTPISSFQIVTGKLLSKLLQLVILLAISLPLLAIVRILGGVPWNYVISSVCITITAVMLAGSVSLLLSIIYRRSYVVVMMTIVGYLLIFGALPGLFNLLAVFDLFIFSQGTTQSITAMINPFVAFAAENATLLQSGIPNFFSWPIHCLIMLAATAVLITISVLLIRQSVLHQTSNQPRSFLHTSIFRRKDKLAVDKSYNRPPGGFIEPVTGSPIIWKEMRKGIIGHRKGEIVIYVLLIGLFLIAAVSLLFIGRGGLGRTVMPHFLMSGINLILLARLAVITAGSLTMEKEARTWPILLTTLLSDEEIVRDKAIAAFGRNMVLILIYFGLLCIRHIQFAGLSKTDVLLYMLSSTVFSACSLIGSVFFVIGSGLYFGVRLKTTTAAVAATVGLYFGVVYLFCGLFNPVRFLIYRTRVPGNSPWLFYIFPFVIAMIQAGVGMAFIRRATFRLRRNVF